MFEKSRCKHLNLPNDQSKLFLGNPFTNRSGIGTDDDSMYSVNNRSGFLNINMSRVSDIQYNRSPSLIQTTS